MSDVKVTLGTVGDDSGARKVEKSIEQLAKEVNQQARAAEQAVPKLRRYSDEIRRAGVLAGELGPAARRMGDEHEKTGGVLSRFATKAAVVGAAVLGIKKFFQALGNAPEIAQFRNQLGEAATAIGSIIGQSTIWRNTLGPLGDALGQFAEGVKKTNIGLPASSAGIRDTATATDALATANAALTESLQSLAVAFDEQNSRSEEHLKNVEAEILAEQELALARTEAIADPEAKAKEQENIRSRFGTRIAGLQSSGKKHLADQMRSQGEFLAAGGAFGFDALPNRDSLVADGERYAELISRRQEIRNRLASAMGRNIDASETAAGGGFFAQLGMDPRTAGFLSLLSPTGNQKKIAGARARLTGEELAGLYDEYRQTNYELHNTARFLPAGVTSGASAAAFFESEAARQAGERSTAKKISLPFFAKATQLDRERGSGERIAGIQAETRSANAASALSAAEREKMQQLIEQIKAQSGANVELLARLLAGFSTSSAATNQLLRAAAEREKNGRGLK